MSTYKPVVLNLCVAASTAWDAANLDQVLFFIFTSTFTWICLFWSRMWITHQRHSLSRCRLHSYSSSEDIQVNSNFRQTFRLVLFLLILTKESSWLTCTFRKFRAVNLKLWGAKCKGPFNESMTPTNIFLINYHGQKCRVQYIFIGLWALDGHLL